MMFVDETKKIIDIMLLKDKNPKQMSVGEALGFWYKASLIPAIAAAVVAGLLVLLGSSIISSIFGTFIGSIAEGIGSVIVLAGIFVSVWILIPIMMIISAAIMHLFGKILLKQFKNGYAATLAATVYVELIVVLFMWLTEIPIIGTILSLIISIWALVAFFVWMARFQNTTWVGVLLTVIVEAIVVGIIMFVVFGAILLSVLGL